MATIHRVRTATDQRRAQRPRQRRDDDEAPRRTRAAAERVRADVTGRAEQEAADIRARANDDISAARERAISDLRAQVADISIELAEKIVERNLDRSTQEQLIESYISSVGNR